MVRSKSSSWSLSLVVVSCVAAALVSLAAAPCAAQVPTADAGPNQWTGYPFEIPPPPHCSLIDDDEVTSDGVMALGESGQDLVEVYLMDGGEEVQVNANETIWMNIYCRGSGEGCEGWELKGNIIVGDTSMGPVNFGLIGPAWGWHFYAWPAPESAEGSLKASLIYEAEEGQTGFPIVASLIICVP